MDDRPNVILIITDDQGHGDLGFHNNPHVQTPVLDELARNSIRFTNFHVSPVCAPTRASLMTGRYSLRTGVRDTYNGGAILSTNEYTIAEMFNDHGYSTGIFGKWHLGDNYPSRPKDQGFQESVIHLSGGMGQVGDFTTYYQKDSSYFDPVLWHNGVQEQYQGYCSDIFTEEAIKFVGNEHEQPFFCYLSFNAPHTPLQVPNSYYQMYAEIDPSEKFSIEDRVPEMNEKAKEDARKVYAMISNIDTNVGKLLEALETLKIRENTIIVFMTDNGPQQVRYTSAMRGRKGSVYNGGTRVPFFVNLPQLNKGIEVSELAAHIDILPTLAEICKIDLNYPNPIDGQSLQPLLVGGEISQKDRSLFSYWTRKYPELYFNMSLHKGDYKLVGRTSYDAKISDFQLYHMDNDPLETNNLINEKKDIGLDLKVELDQIYTDLIRSPNLLEPPYIEIGSEFENPTILNRNDAGGERGIWAQEEIFGQWRVKVNQGKYRIKLKMIKPISGEGYVLLEVGKLALRKSIAMSDEDEIILNDVAMEEFIGNFTPTVFIDGRRIFPFWVSFELLD